jgi:CHAT domain-containing protein
MYYDSLNEDLLQREAIDSCIAVDLRISGNYYYSSVAMKAKITDLFNKGDYVLCVKWSDLLEKILIDNFPERIDDIWYSIFYHVNGLIFLNKFDDAEKFLNSRFNSKRFAQIPDSLGTTYMSFGIINYHKKSYQTALNYFQKSAETNKKINYWIGYAQALNWMGSVYSEKLDDYEKGISVFKKALVFADDIEAISILSFIAHAYVKLNLFDSASFYFQKAFDRIKPGITENELIDLAAEEAIKGKAVEYVTRLVIYKGDALLKQYKFSKNAGVLNNAIDVYKLADRLLTRVKSMQLDMQTKLFWRAHTKSLYENAIEASYLAGNLEGGLYFFEKSRAVLLNDQLNEQRWIAEKDIVRRSKVENEIRKTEEKLVQLDKSSTRHKELEKQIFEKRQELERLQEQLKSNNPLYYQNFVDTNFINLKDVHNNLLKDHQALVELFSGDSAVYLLCITAKRTVLKKINKKEFDSLSQSFIGFLSSSTLLNKNFSEFVSVSRHLYQLMFFNVELPTGRIIISPDGQYFPFEALISRNQAVYYFVKDFAVSYTYSARWLLSDFSVNSTSQAKTFLGVAPVRFSNGLPALSGSDESLKRIQYYFNPATSLIGANATKRNFISQFADYRIIQLYTHAAVDGSMSEPTIYFSDSALTISELFYDTRPATSLVVLAACETGLGDLHPGEGVFSFNRAFAALGIPSAVSNLWQVDNQASYKITELFYKNVADGLPLDISLQKAKIEYFSKADLENKLPYFWAAPVLVGQTNKVSMKDSSWKWLGLIIPFFLIAFLLELRTRRKFKRS